MREEKTAERKERWKGTGISADGDCKIKRGKERGEEGGRKRERGNAFTNTPPPPLSH